MLSSIVLLSLFCLGLRSITSEGMIGWPLRKAALTLAEKSVFLEYAMKPVILCVVCLSSVWGTLFYFLSVPLELSTNFFLNWLILCVGASFPNYLLWTLFDQIQSRATINKKQYPQFFK